MYCQPSKTSNKNVDIFAKRCPATSRYSLRCIRPIDCKMWHGSHVSVRSEMNYAHTKRHTPYSPSPFITIYKSFLFVLCCSNQQRQKKINSTIGCLHAPHTTQTQHLKAFDKWSSFIYLFSYLFLILRFLFYCYYVFTFSFLHYYSRERAVTAIKMINVTECGLVWL